MLLISRIYGLGSCRLPCFTGNKLLYGFKVKGTRKLFQKAPLKQKEKETEAKTFVTPNMQPHKTKFQRRQPHQTNQSTAEGGSSFGRNLELNQFESEQTMKKGDPSQPQTKAAKSKIQDSKIDEKSRQIIEQLRKGGHQEQASTLLLHLQRKNVTAYNQYLLQVCWKLYPQPLPSIIDAITLYYFSTQGLSQLNSMAVAQLFQKCLSAYSQQIADAIERQNLGFIQLLKLWMAYNQYRLMFYSDSEEMIKFGQLLMRNILNKIALSDLSTEQNLKAIEQYYKSDNVRSIVGAQIDFLLAFCEQLPFFPLPTLQRSLQMIFASRKLYSLLKSKSLKAIIEIITMQVDDLIEIMPLDSIFNMVVPLMRLIDRYQQQFEQRDRLVGLIFRAMLQRKFSKSQFTLNLKSLSRFLNLVGGRIIFDEPRSVRSELFGYVLKEIRRWETLKQQYIRNNIKMLEEVLTLLFKFDILIYEDCRLELQQLRKKVSAISTIDEQTIIEFQQFLSTEVKEISHNFSQLSLDDFKKLGSYQIYDKLSEAITQQNLQVLETIIKILLNGRGGHYFYSFCKVRVAYHRAEALFNQAINKLVDHKRLYIFKQIFYRNLKKADKRSSTVNEILSSLNFKNNLNYREIWSCYFIGWARACYEETQDERHKVISSFFNTLIKLKDKALNESDIVCNPHFYSVLLFILHQIQKKKKFQDQENLHYFYSLLDFLLTKEKQDKQISLYLASIIYNPRMDQLLTNSLQDSSLIGIITNIFKFKLRYKSFSHSMDSTYKIVLSKDSPIKLTEYQKRLILLCQGECRNKTPLPVLKENLPLLLAENELYSIQEKEEIDALLSTCDDHDLSQILSSPISQLIPRAKLKRIWKLFLQKLNKVNRIMWRNLISNYYQKDWLETESKELTMKLLQYYHENVTELSIGNFKMLSEALFHSGLIHKERQLVNDLLQRYCQQHFQTYLYLPKDKIFQSFKIYILAGYLLKLQFLGELIQPISRNAECYSIIFSYEDITNPKQFKRLLQHFLFHRKDYLQEEYKIQDSLALNLLKRQYTATCGQFLQYNEENNSKQRRFILKSFDFEVYKMLSDCYQGIVYKDPNYIQLEDSVIVILQTLSQKIKNKFMTKALSAYPQTKDKAIKFISINGSSTTKNVAQYVASQLGLKPKDQSLNSHEEKAEESLEEILAKEVSEVDLQLQDNLGNTSNPQK